MVVEDDPRLNLSAQDRAARRAAIQELYDMVKTTSKDRGSIVGLQSSLKSTREKWKKESAKKDGLKIPEDIQKQADELQRRVDEVALKYQREREGLGNAGPPLVWRPAPLPGQAQGLLEDLDDFAAAPGSSSWTASRS